MLSILDGYVARTFLGSFVILLAVGVALYVVTDLLVNIDEFTRDHGLAPREVLALMADFYGHNLPLYFSQLCGPAIAIAAAFTLGYMLRNNEMTALVASGMPLQRIVVPLATCAVGLVALWIANRELVMPAWAAKIARTHDAIAGRPVGGVYCARDARNAILTAVELDPRAGRMRGVYIIEPDQGRIPTNLIEADEARYDAERRTWVLERGRRMVVGDPFRAGALGDPIRYEIVDEFPFGLSAEELALRQSAEWADLLSLREMNALLRSGNLPNSASIAISRHVRLTYPLLMCVLLLLTLPHFLTREPASVISAGGGALLMAGLFFTATFVVHGAMRDEATAALSAWLPILVFGPIGVLQLANVKS